MAYQKSIRLKAAIPDWTKLKRLSAAEKGEPAYPEVFEKVTEAQVNLGLQIQQKFAEDFCQKFGQKISLAIDIYRLQVNKYSYDEFVAKMSKEFIVQVDLDYPGIGMLYAFMNNSLAQAFINRMTGGPGEAKIENEELTKIEQAVFEELIQEAGQSLAQAWKNVLPVSPQKIALTAPRCKALTSFSEKEELLQFTAEIGWGEDTVEKFSWVYPLNVFINLIKQWQSFPKTTRRQIKLSPFAVSLVDVPVHAVLGKTIVSMSDLLQLQRGDVIILDNKINEPSILRIGEDDHFFAQAGIYNKHISMQVIEPLSKFKKTEKEDLSVFPGPEEEGSAGGHHLAAERLEEETADTANEEEKNEKDDILDNIEDFDEEEDEDFVWDEEDNAEEDF
ncbi:MAG: FliM/FliN family flagellar motor switch protein [Candidatus Margulisbacteria bacterium]|nr:FliM/FliN family flagellar motor switch protein [Candidatus Margulisiibacteriota bacterium]